VAAYPDRSSSSAPLPVPIIEDPAAKLILCAACSARILLLLHVIWAPASRLMSPALPLAPVALLVLMLKFAELSWVEMNWAVNVSGPFSALLASRVD
jgi:hypothetical protein